MKTILSQLNKSYTGTSLAHIAVEVGEEEDIRLLVQSGTVDWTETGENEDPAILWALKNDKLAIFDLLAPVSNINLQGDPSADLTVVCDSETFRVHRNLLCYRSPVFRAMLDSDMREAREGEIIIQDMDSTTVRSMIHYIYTGEMSEDWQDLDILEVARAADMYDLPGWIEELSPELMSLDVTGGLLAGMIIAGSRYPQAKEFRKIVIQKIKDDKKVLQDPTFLSIIRREDPLCLVNLLEEMFSYI